MKIPLVNTLLSVLEKRKGGGGKGGGGGSSGAKGGGGGGESTSGGGSSGSRAVPVSGLPSSSRGASSYGTGGGSPITIPAGQPFAGRTSGGATRDQVFGSRAYGSGYQGLPARSVAGRSFPFGFWPVVWGTGGIGTAAYLHNTEYGRADNSSRPGGALFQAQLQEPNDNSTFHLIADNSTVSAIIDALESNCTLSTDTIVPQPFDPDNSSQPQPEQAIQYYRSSSIVLTLDGYNDSAAYSNDNNTQDTPLPSTLNSTFLDCLNQTIAASAPITDASYHMAPPVVTVWLLLIIARILL